MSASMPSASMISRAISDMRQLFEISPGQVPSLRADALMTRMRLLVSGFFWIFSASSRRSRAAFQSIDRS